MRKFTVTASHPQDYADKANNITLKALAGAACDAIWDFQSFSNGPHDYDALSEEDINTLDSARDILARFAEG